MRTTRYWVVPWIGVVSTPLPPELVGNGRFRPLPPVTERYQSRKKMEKKRENLEIQCRYGEERWYQPREGERRGGRKTWSSAALPPRYPSPAGDFFSPRGEKKRFPAWGEGTRRSHPFF
ncbi:hypothetical protein GW17_00034351 [Ensete ventricosum]|nr:hypothetical protein GW17_00034351 [Ensete ventricosum]